MDTRRILADLRSERDRIDRAISALESLNSAAKPQGRRPAAQAAPAPQRRRRRRMSAAGRKRISEMMKQRWAERKKKAAKGA
jgi:hypothetical protein